MFRISFCALLLALVFSAPAAAQVTAPEDPVRYIRAFVLKGSYEQAVTEGTALLATNDDAELKAWFVAGLVRSGDVKGAIEMADLMVAMEGETPWSWFAKAAALTWAKGQEKEALAASDKALALNPEHPDFVWIRAQALLADGTPESRRRLTALFEKYAALVDQHPELAALKARATVQTGN